MALYHLDPDRFFDAETSVRKYARTIYESIQSLPIISPHGHVDPALFLENNHFNNPTELFIIPDHYLFRMLYSQGISLESLGIKPINSSEYIAPDPRVAWKIFCKNYFLFNGTPTGIWLDYELHSILNIKERPDEENADRLFDEITDKLQSDEFLPRNIYEKSNIEILATTDSATDSLSNHAQIASLGWKGTIIPTFRPDSISTIDHETWVDEVKKLETITDSSITNFSTFLDAIRIQRNYFKSLGATATDHGVFTPYSCELSKNEADALFQKALNKDVTHDEAKKFNGYMLMKYAEMSLNDGLVMQIHPGCYRNHNLQLFQKYGPDKGHDIPVAVEYTKNLRPLLNTYGNEPDLTIIIFTLDESTYSRELAPLAGHYPALKLGPAWWFNDSINGMNRFRQLTLETAGFYNTVGFNDDTRALLSIPARHDVARRVDSNYLANLVSRHIVSLEVALTIARDLTYTLVKKAYKFD